MTKSKFILLTFISILGLYSCEEAVVLDLEFESRIVVNSFFDSDSPWAIEVSTSENIIDPQDKIELVENARVIVYDHNNIELYELYHIENGVYGREGYYPSPRRTYKIKVEVGAKVVTAESYVPEQSKLQINNIEIVTMNKNEGIEVDFQIEDKSNIEAYYLWEIVSVVNSGGDGEEASNGDKLSDALISNLESKSLTSETEEIQIFGKGVFGNGTYSTVYNTFQGRAGGRFNPNTTKGGEDTKDLVQEIDNFTDFDDSEYHFDPSSDGDGVDGDDDKDPIIYDLPEFELRVVTISKELYDYYNSVEDARTYSNTSESNRIPIYTNVNNGLGIFAGFSESIIRF